ncbi:MAG: TIM barrel protein, partial [Phenylobacterium sp.]|nr:TIM barrel protein [Phenylobacterium sp.]
LTLDTGHAALGGVNAPAVIRDHPERVVHVHCKDVRWETFTKVRKTGASFLDGVLAGMFTVPGDGGIDFAEVTTALKAVNYAGWIVIEAEQDPAMANPKAYAEIGLGALMSRAAAAGLV